jgi:hypothetical protein
MAGWIPLRPRLLGSCTTASILPALSAGLLLLLPATLASGTAGATTSVISPPFTTVGASAYGGGHSWSSGCLGNGSTVNVLSRPWSSAPTGHIKASVAAALVACGPPSSSGSLSYSGKVGLQNVSFNVSKYGKYKVTFRFHGWESDRESLSLLGPNNSSSGSVVSVNFWAGMTLRDVYNSSWGSTGGGWNDHAKSCGNRYFWRCPLDVQSLTNGSPQNFSSHNFTFSFNLSWWSGPYKWLVPGDTYAVSTQLQFWLGLSTTSAASGSRLASSLAFDLRCTSVVVYGPY